MPPITMPPITTVVHTPKAPTGIRGLDTVMGGGVPSGRTTLLEGGPGMGKTVLALQTLVHGARAHGEPGIFVAFEEHPERIVRNAESFGWDLSSLEGDRLAFLDARPDTDLIQSGAFDLGGLLAVLGARTKRMGAKRIVFDALDVVLALMPDARSVRREVYRLHDWLLANELTAIITTKAARTAGDANEAASFMQFMVDCAIVLGHDLVQGVSQRHLRVVKYRGSSFLENVHPYVIGPEGFEVARTDTDKDSQARISTERLSTGVSRLDTMLGGGYFRGAAILVTGAPGTAKTTLSGAFTLSSCERGDRTIFVSFDSPPAEIVRNLASVAIDLAPHVAAGTLKVVAAHALRGSAESHLLYIERLVEEHGARCLVIDPVSALGKSGNDKVSRSVVERLVEWCKHVGVTLMCTSLIDVEHRDAEGTPIQISTIADTWIHLDYLVRGGERNRTLSIVKSRGTEHSNQVRELLLSHGGVTLADVYVAGGEVLMGTLRFERERAERQTTHEREEDQERSKRLLDVETAELGARLEILRTQLALKERERRALDAAGDEDVDRHSAGLRSVHDLRGGDRMTTDGGGSDG